MLTKIVETKQALQVDDVKKEERKEEIERPSVAAKADDNEDIFSISR